MAHIRGNPHHQEKVKVEKVKDKVQVLVKANSWWFTWMARNI